MVSLIAAMARNRVIGRDGGLPWQIPADLQRFRERTTGHTIIMGRKTYESIGRPLPGRRTVVVTRQERYQAPGCIVVHSLAEALQAAAGEAELFICGGGDIYRQALPLADRIWLTVVELAVAGDTLFPELPPGEFAETMAERISDDPPAVVHLLERVCAGGGCAA